MACQSRVLFIDAYDSFSNNIIALLRSQCNVHVTKVYIDAEIADLEAFLEPYVAVVCGPGPGHPARSDDVGLFSKIWTLSDNNMLPVLGICLGFQSLAYTFGATICRLPQPRHGIRTRIVSSMSSIFEDTQHFHTIQYHSLYVDVGQYNSTELDPNLWKPFEPCLELQPLAWEFETQAELDSTLRANPSAILMAIKHLQKPFYGIQFHPESVCSDSSASQVVSKWWLASLAWIASNRPSKLEIADNNALERPDASNWKTALQTQAGCWKFRGTSTNTTHPKGAPTSDLHLQHSESQVRLRLASSTLPRRNLTVESIIEVLGLEEDEIVILDSEMRQLPELGETSIIGIILPDTTKFKYRVGTRYVALEQADRMELIDLGLHNNDVFSIIKAFMSEHVIDEHYDRPFCGGLIGYINYEACLETMGIHVPPSSHGPDICFAFVEHSILIDHTNQVVYLQSLETYESSPEVSRWLDEVTTKIDAISRRQSHGNSVAEFLSKQAFQSTLPVESEYRSKIAECKELINDGESYELCLTDQTSLALAAGSSSWDMYCKLRRQNPAPFASYVRLGPLTLLSTSPERFLSWSRAESSSHKADDESSDQYITCQFRPIKGTVQKRQVRSDGSVHLMSREEATSILATDKEQAENLMIVDLIRHDLGAVCENVYVKALMVVEEYESVFQLVSVIEGRLAISTGLNSNKLSGIDCLAASLPPGSMTGAPKRRSCQLLRQIETAKPRSVYSGVLGYMCVSGKGDFSVVIRSIFKWSDDGRPSESWNIGAGGAITTLSSEDDEWEEMLAKLRTTYRLFDSDF